MLYAATAQRIRTEPLIDCVLTQLRIGRVQGAGNLTCRGCPRVAVPLLEPFTRELQACSSVVLQGVPDFRPDFPAVSRGYSSRVREGKTVAMLLNQFKTGSAASSLVGSSRDGLVLRQLRKMGKSESLQVKAAARESSKGGWLESAGAKLEKVGGFLERTLHNDGTTTVVLDPNMEQYKGKAVIMKKLLELDLIDRGADLADDASELFRGKHATVQLVSPDIDPGMLHSVHFLM